MAKKKPLKKAKSKAKTQTKAAKKQPETRKAQPKQQKQENINIIDPSGTTFWQAATVTFALLFLISIFTHGFTFDNTTAVDTHTEKMLTNTTSGPDTTAPATTTPTSNTVKVNAIVITDERCGQVCDTTQLISQLKSLFPGLTADTLDYSEKEAKDIMKETETKYLPVLLFDETVKEAESYPNVERYLEETGKYLSLKIGASWDPEAEICDNEIDDNGDGKIDCDDTTCASELICNKDAIVECAKPYNITADTVIFYYSNGCGWCAKMKPGVEELQDEGYSFYWAEGSDAESAEVIEKCISEYMTGGGVPQFICMKNADIHVGAFTDENRDLDVEGLRKFADDCIAS